MNKKELVKEMRKAYNDSATNQKHWADILAYVRELGYHWVAKIYKCTKFVIGGGSAEMWISEDDIKNHPKDWNVSIGEIRLRRKPYKLTPFGFSMDVECPYK